MNFQNSQTKKNLEAALKGEALAHLKYQFYKSQLSNISKEIESELDEIIHNEKEHGKIWFKQLHDGAVPDNEANLLDAIEGELYEHSAMYPEFAKKAFEEGFDEIGNLFSGVAEIEGRHAENFENILKNIKEDKLFLNKEKTDWICLNCGHIVHGVMEAPEECPICKHPQKYFIRCSTN